MQAKYLDFLEYIMGKLNKYFAEQSPYIKCKKGCAKCCSNGEYPFTEAEFELLKTGFIQLDENTKLKIKNNISEILKEKEAFKEKKKFTYKCPFLIDNICSVYLYRGLICRTFGLLYTKEDSDIQIPFCAYENLNYSSVLDKKNNKLSSEKMKESGISVEPQAYNIHWNFLTSERVGKTFGVDFGKKASLIDFLREDDIFKN